MRSHRLSRIGAFALAWLSAASMLAAPIGKPTPCPCTADGSCSPAGPWGYNKTQWRLWPGTTLDQRDGAESSAIGSDRVGPIDPPDSRAEDKLAPPKVEALDPAPVEPPAEDSEFELPEDEEFENGGPAAPAERPDPLVPRRPGFMDRAPGEARPGPAPAGEGAPAAEPSLPFGQPPAAPPTELFPSSSSEAPADGPSLGVDSAPPLPVGLAPQQRMPRPNVSRPTQVMPATAQMQSSRNPAMVSRIPVYAAEQSATSRRNVEAPPKLPAGLLQGR